MGRKTAGKAVDHDGHAGGAAVGSYHVRLAILIHVRHCQGAGVEASRKCVLTVESIGIALEQANVAISLIGYNYVLKAIAVEISHHDSVGIHTRNQACDQTESAVVSTDQD